MGDYASKGVAGAGLGLGVAGLSVALLQGANNGGGILGGLLGGNCCNGAAIAAMQGNGYVAALAQKGAEIGELKAEKYTDNKVDGLNLALTNRINAVAADLATLSLNNERRISQIEGQMSCLAQATNTAIAGINNTINGITKTVVMKEAICPEVMPRYNSWTAPTATEVAPAAQPITGSIKVTS